MAITKAANAVEADPLVEAIEAMTKKLDLMTRHMEEQLHLQKVALLEDGHILRFSAAGAHRIALSLPDAQVDFVQRVILRTRNFYEAQLLGAVKDMGLVGPGSVVCDVGANIGNHTVYFAKVMGAGKVLAFEPQEYCRATLAANVALNGLQDRVVAHGSMVGAASGQGHIEKFNARNMGGTAFAVSDDGDVPMVALDDVVGAEDVARLDLVKIDVEGMHMEVLTGAAGILATRKPAIWVELLARDNAFEVANGFLKRFGYKPTPLGLNDVLFRV